MKGREYEQFVAEKFRRLFPDATVTQNDHIRGSLSGLDREIDVSVRMTVGEEKLLYIAQCKDWKTPADIKVLGEFSSVVQDVQAAKGFLLCTSGFAKTNHQYARTLGIELITIEDIKSAKWKTEAQIPFIYVRKNFNYGVVFDFVANEALVEKNRDKDLVIELSQESLLSCDGGATTVRFKEYLDENIEMLEKTLLIGVENDIWAPNLHILVADIWVPFTAFSFTLFSIAKKFYLKYLAPVEYCHLRDHVRGTTLPLHVVLRNVGFTFDDSFIELTDDKPPVIAGLHLQVEEWTPVEIAQKEND